MSKTCFIYETLNGVKDLSVKRDGDFMTLSGVFGVCGVKNNNKRVYETSNYSKMVSEMQERIKAEGGIPGELEHPQNMNITLENVSHKITDIQIDENGLVTGSITLLNTPKGKIAQAIVEGGLPLFISSRATGNVDSKTGNVTLEKISTYDLVGSPGFSQARLKLNENQIAESINESQIYYITEKENNEDMELQEILNKIELLENRIADLENENETLQEQLNEKQNIDLEKLANGIQNWIVEEYSPMIQNWIVEEYSSSIENEVNEEEIVENVIDKISPSIQNWVVEEYSPKVQEWIVEEYSPKVQEWCIEEFSQGIQNWVVEEFSPEVENWLNESYKPSIENSINESISESKKNSLNAIDETLSLLESIEVSKPVYKGKAIITENIDEPKYIQEMPAEARVKWDMASNEVKESIKRRAKLYNFVNEGSIERFWDNVDFAEIKPVQNIYEGLENITDQFERDIRAKIRSSRFRKM